MVRQKAASKVKAAYYAQWLPWSDGCKRVRSATGSWKLAAVELKDKLASGQIQTMDRVSCGDKIEERKLPTEFWRTAGIAARRDRSRSAAADTRDGYLTWGAKNQLWDPFKEPKDIQRHHHVFFRRADVDALWPPESTVPSGTTNNSDRRKPGPKPRHDWQKNFASELIRIIHSLGEIPTNDTKLANDLLNLFEKRWTWLPDQRDVRRLVRELLDPVRKNSP